MPAYYPAHRSQYKPARGAVLDRGNPLTRGLIWGALLNEQAGQTVCDLSGNNNNGVFTGFGWGSKPSSLVPQGGGASLNGTTSRIAVTTNAGLFTPTAASFALWVYNTGSNWTSMYIMQQGTSSSDFLALATNASSQPIWIVNGVAITSATALTTFKSFFLVGTVDSAGNGTLYVNNISKATSAGTQTIGTYVAGLALGSRGGGTTSIFNKGIIDLALYWNRQLTAAEVNQLFIDQFAFMAPSPLRRIFSTGAGAVLYTASLSGSMASSGVLTKSGARALAGTSASAGTIANQTNRALAGTGTSAGTLTKSDARSLSGSTSSAGSITKSDGRALAGTTASAGAITKSDARTLTGAGASSGALSKSSGRALAGSTASSGAVSKQTARSLAGSVASAGSLVTSTARTLTGAVASSGTLSGMRVRVLTLTGSMASAGTLARSISRALTGTTAGSGTLSKQTSRTITGTSASAGTLARSLARSVAGSTASSGTVARVLTRPLAGTLASAGTLIKRLARTLGGVLDSIGSLTFPHSGPPVVRATATITLAPAPHATLTAAPVPTATLTLDAAPKATVS